MSTKADELARGVASIFGGKKPKREEKSWLRHFSEALVNEFAENLPPMRMLKGMVEGNAEEFFVKGVPPVQAARGLVKKVKTSVTGDLRDDEGGTEDLIGGIAGTANYLGTGPNAALPALVGKAKVPVRAAIEAEKKLTGKLTNKFPSLGKDIVLDSRAVTNANLPKFKLEGGNARKAAKVEKLVEQSGGTKFKLDAKTGDVSWVDKSGKKQTANIQRDRLGPRAFGLSDRQLGNNPRAEDADSLLSGDIDNIETLKASGDDIVSRVSEKSGVSREKMRELHKTGEGHYAKERLYRKAEEELDEWDEDIEDIVDKKEMRVNKPKMEGKLPDRKPVDQLSEDELRWEEKHLDYLTKNPVNTKSFSRIPGFGPVKDTSADDLARLAQVRERLGKLPPMSGEMRAPKPKMSSRNIDDDLPTFSGRHAADAGGTSVEEIHRQGSFYKIGKNGEPTYLSKAVDAGNLGPDDAIIHVVPGREPVIYQGSGPKNALLRFKKTKTGSQFYKHEVGAGAKIKLAKKRQTVSATKIPTIDAARYGKHVTDKVNGRKIKFASDFDKVTYALASSRIPNRKILNHVMKLTGFDEDTILQHGFRIKGKVDQGLAKKGRGAIQLHPRSIQVIGEAKTPSMKRQILGFPSEFIFSLDQPLLRQAFKASVTHPFKTGLPALRRALGAATERGYRQQIENFPDELGLYDVLDTMTAVGPTKAEKIYPHGGDLTKLGGAKHDVYDYFGTGNAGERVPLFGEIPKLSRRMYDVGMRSVRGTETERMAEKLGMTVQELAKKGHTELPSMVRSVNERTGHGPLGVFEPASEALSTVFTAPRNTSASMQTFNPLNYLPESVLPEFVNRHGLGGRYGTNFSSPIYQDHLKDTAKLLAGYGALEGADRLFWDNEKVTLNPLDSRIGMNIRNWHPDIFGGAQGTATLAPKLTQPLLRAGAEKLDEVAGTELEGAFTGINSKGEERNFSPVDELTKYLRYRVRPGIPAMLADATLGYNEETGEPGDNLGTFNTPIGEDISAPYSADNPIKNVPLLGPLSDLPYSRWIGNQVTPSYLSNTYDAFTGAGTPEGIAAAALGFLGAGGSTYDPFEQMDDEYRAPYRYIRVPRRENKPGRIALPGGVR